MSNGTPWSLACICWCGPALHPLNAQQERERAPRPCCRWSCKHFPLVQTCNFIKKDYRVALSFSYLIANLNLDHKDNIGMITVTKMKHLMASLSLTGCFLDLFVNSAGMGIISGGGRSAVRSSSPNMAACWVKSISCRKDMLRFRAKSRSWTQGSDQKDSKGLEKAL